MKYYRISLKEQRGAFRVKPDLKYSYIKIFHNPEPLINQIFKIYKGTKKMDVMGYCETVNFAISDNFKNVLEENSITGWTTYPIKIENLEDIFYGFQVIGKGGEVTNRDKYGDVPMFKPVKWNMEKWDGSDIFYIEETLVTVCTERVKEVVEKAKITNIIFEPF
jgi:hypothetical protein